MPPPPLPDCLVPEPRAASSSRRARQLAQKRAGPPQPESIAEQLAARRAEQQAALGGGGGQPGGGAGLVFTDVAEFARTIRVKEEGGGGVKAEQGEEEGAAAGAAAAAVKKEEQLEEAGRGPEDMDMAGAGAGSGPSASGWAPAEGGESGGAAEMRRRIRAKREAEEGGGSGDEGSGGEEGSAQEQSVIGERTIGSGLAGALAFLKDRGELNTPVEWAGRRPDSKKINVSGARGRRRGSARAAAWLALARGCPAPLPCSCRSLAKCLPFPPAQIQGLEEVYTGGRQEDRLASDVEVCGVGRVGAGGQGAS